jgi:hypothetical protein
MSLACIDQVIPSLIIGTNGLPTENEIPELTNVNDIFDDFSKIEVSFTA